MDVEVPKKPGLGIEVDLEQVKKLIRFIWITVLEEEMTLLECSI